MKQRQIGLLTLFLTFGFSLTSCHNDILDEDIDSKFIRKPDISTIATSEHTFPTVHEIKQSSTVNAAMHRAWNIMKSLVVPYVHRQEVGFYIYYIESTKSYWIGDFAYGPITPYSTEEPARINLGPVKNNLQVCAFFHCHTPWYGSSVRQTGASDQDIKVAYEYGLPGIVFDYTVPFMSLEFVHEYDSIPPRSIEFGPERRSPIYY